MTLKTISNLVQGLNLGASELEVFNALIEYFHSEAIQISEPITIPGCHDSQEYEDDEYEWIACDSQDYIGSLCYGRKHRYSVKKFYWSPPRGKDYDSFFVLTDCVPEEMREHLWTEQETDTILYSTSDARSECRTY